MKNLKFLITPIIGTALMIATTEAIAVSISLVPSINKIHSGETLFLGIDISGLHSGGTDSLLGGWSMDIGYDPGVLQATAFLSIGPYLGSIEKGQAIDFHGINFSVPGVISLGELSLLPIDNYFDTAWNPGLDCVQRQPECEPNNSNQGGSPLDFFRLATVSFQLANPNAALPGQYTSITTQNIILSDGFGDEILVASYPSVSVQVPEPPVIFLLVFGLMLMDYRKQKSSLKAITKSKYTLVKRYFRWIYLLVISMFLCVSTASNAASAQPIPDGNINLTIKSTSKVSENYYITKGNSGNQYLDSIIPMAVSDSDDFSGVQISIKSTQTVTITFTSDALFGQHTNQTTSFTFTNGIYFIAFNYDDVFGPDNDCNMTIQKYENGYFGNSLLSVKQKCYSYSNSYFRTNGVNGILQTVATDNSETVVKQFSIPNSSVTFGNDLFPHTIICTDPTHCNSMTRVINIGGYGEVTLTSPNGAIATTSTVDVTSRDRFEFTGDAYSLRITHTRLSPTATDIKSYLDDWLDNRWSGQSPQSLIQAINDVGLNISDVEKILLNGRSQYPNTPDQLGQIITGKPIQAEHVNYSSEYLIYVPTSYKKTVQAPLIVYGHGGSLCRDLNFDRDQAIAGMNNWISNAENSGSILVAPLTERGWGGIGYSILLSTLSEVQRNYNIDPNRIYVTGHSMGGHLAYRSGIYLGDRWAAISPMSGGYDYVATGLVENLFDVHGFATWGEFDDYELTPFNRKIQDWMLDHGYPWKNLEKAGGRHAIFPEYLDDVGDLFTNSKRNLYPKEVFAGAGPWDAPGGLNLPNLKIDTVATNENSCGTTYTWQPDRPIPASSFSWLELKPADNVSTVQRVWAVNKGNNIFEITSEGTRELRVYLHPYMVDFKKPVVIKANGETVHNDIVEPSLATMLELARKYDDRGRLFYAAVDINIATDTAPQSPVGSHIQDLVGDKDSFVSGDAADIPFQSARVDQLLHNLATQIGGQYSAVNLDIDGSDRAVGWTHKFVLPDDARITSATIKLRLKGNNSLVSNDELLYEATALDSLFLPFIALQDLNNGIRPKAGQPFELTLNLAKAPVRIICPECMAGGSLKPLVTSGNKQNGEYRNLLPLLYDGQFDLALSDDAMVDYSELQITYALPNSEEGDLDGNGVIDKNDLNIINQAVNTPAYTDRTDPRDLDHDGKITVLDARKLVLLCAKPLCAV